MGVSEVVGVFAHAVDVVLEGGFGRVDCCGIVGGVCHDGCLVGERGDCNDDRRIMRPEMRLKTDAVVVACCVCRLECH